MNKTKELKKLARKRKQTNWLGYKNIGDYHNGMYECNYVSPYSRSAHNVNSKIIVFLQDWSSDESMYKKVDLETAKLGYTPSVSTNKNLIRLLRQHFKLSLKDIYATNLFPFIKMGSVSANIPSKDMLQAAKEFGIPQLDIIKPNIAICLGLKTFNAFRKTLNLQPVKTIDKAIKKPFQFKTTMIFCQAHTGRLGQNNRNRNGVERVTKDWVKMEKYLKIKKS